MPSTALPKVQMTADSLVSLLDLLEGAGLEVWLDGGWGVDALLCEQTRPHKDVDLIPRVADTPRLCELLEPRGFSLKEGELPHTFVLHDGAGLEVDVHAVHFDASGDGIYRPQAGDDWVFPAESFTGRGRVAGRPVRCLSAAAQVQCHAQGYEPVEKDLRDMQRLHERFGVALPPMLRREPHAQLALIESVREKCASDPRVRAALQYGSFAKGEGDEHSDVEFYVFVDDSAFEGFDNVRWVAELRPVLAYFRNEFGTQVAIFDDLLRGEFHFEPHSAAKKVANWGSVEKHAGELRMLLHDEVGELTAALAAIERKALTPDALQAIYDRFLNWFLLGQNVMRRGERARALDALGHVHVFLLQLSRAQEGSIDHWLTPSRSAEQDLSAAAMARFRACTADLLPGSLESAFGEAWAWSGQLGEALGLDPRSAVRRGVDELIHPSRPSTLR